MYEKSFLHAVAKQNYAKYDVEPKLEKPVIVSKILAYEESFQILEAITADLEDTFWLKIFTELLNLYCVYSFTYNRAWLTTVDVFLGVCLVFLSWKIPMCERELKFLIKNEQIKNLRI